MGVYNRKSWIHNGTKHWIHNGKHYRKRLGFFGTKRKFKRKYSEKKRRYSDEELRHILTVEKNALENGSLEWARNEVKNMDKKKLNRYLNSPVRTHDEMLEDDIIEAYSYERKNNLDKYTHTWEGKTDDEFLNEIYQANEDFEHDLDIDSKIAELDGYY